MESSRPRVCSPESVTTADSVAQMLLRQHKARREGKRRKPRKTRHWKARAAPESNSESWADRSLLRRVRAKSRRRIRPRPAYSVERFFRRHARLRAHETQRHGDTCNLDARCDGDLNARISSHASNRKYRGTSIETRGATLVTIGSSHAHHASLTPRRNWRIHACFSRGARGHLLVVFVAHRVHLASRISFRGATFGPSRRRRANQHRARTSASCRRTRGSSAVERHGC